MLQDGKKLHLQQQKLIRIADREEDGWEVVKCYLSDDLVQDSDDQKQLLMTLREAYRKKQFQNVPPPSIQKIRKSFEFVNRPQADSSSSFRSYRAASNKKKGEGAKQKDRKKQFRNAPSPFTPLQIIFRICQQIIVRLQQQLSELPIWIKSLFPLWKRRTFSIQLLPSKETSLPEYELGRDWEYSENCNELISM